MNDLDDYLEAEFDTDDRWPWQLTFMVVVGCLLIIEILVIAGLALAMA